MAFVLLCCRSPQAWLYVSVTGVVVFLVLSRVSIVAAHYEHGVSVTFWLCWPQLSVPVSE